MDLSSLSNLLDKLQEKKNNYDANELSMYMSASELVLIKQEVEPLTTLRIDVNIEYKGVNEELLSELLIVKRNIFIKQFIKNYIIAKSVEELNDWLSNNNEFQVQIKIAKEKIINLFNARQRYKNSIIAGEVQHTYKNEIVIHILDANKNVTSIMTEEFNERKFYTTNSLLLEKYAYQPMPPTHKKNKLN